ncbi:MAG: hypothetical protein QM761_00690 [Pseudoxanthomonas sp.]
MSFPTSFIETLHSEGPAADRRDGLQLYAFLIGRWEYDARYHLDNGRIRQSSGEIHAGWVLGGRAIQDVWIVPARGLPRPQPPDFGDYFGTTLRVYDPALDAWHILWSDPLRQTYCRQLGRARGEDIVQEGEDDGVRQRWSFREIAADSFRWTGESSHDGGADWKLYADFRVRRA